MPRISAFDGIVVRMYWKEGHHRLPHFHVQVAEDRASLAIGDLKVIVGSVPSRHLRRVRKWAALHQAELEANWKRVRNQEAPHPIEPLHRKGSPRGRCR